jgi:hypothetical protein
MNAAAASIATGAVANAVVCCGERLSKAIPSDARLVAILDPMRKCGFSFEYPGKDVRNFAGAVSVSLTDRPICL